MPHIQVPSDIPGIRGLMSTRPELAAPLLALAQALLRSPSPLTAAERELIAVHVSARNRCRFCATSHAAAARHLLGGDPSLVDAVRELGPEAPVSPKMRALLALAGKVQESGLSVTPEDVEAARALGATDVEIHDTVLVAAAFCMFNRYVDGLGAITPDDPAVYEAMGQRLATQGYG